MLTIEQTLLDSQAAAAAIAAARLLKLGLWKQQPSVLAYLVSNVAGCLLLGYLMLQSGPYYWFFLVFQTLSDLLAMLVVRELFAVAVARYPGIETAGRWMMYGSVSVSAVASLGLTAILWEGAAGGKSNLYYALVLHRSLQFSMAVVIISLVAFLSHYPLELRRNFHVSSYFFSCVFLIEAAQSLVDTLSRYHFSREVDITSVGLVALALVSWAFLLRHEEALPPKHGTRTPADDALIQQLESLNRTLSGLPRR